VMECQAFLKTRIKFADTHAQTDVIMLSSKATPLFSVGQTGKYAGHLRMNKSECSFLDKSFRITL